MNFPRASFVFIGAAVVVCAVIYLNERTARRKAETRSRQEFADLRESMDGLAGELARLRSSIESSEIAPRTVAMVGTNPGVTAVAVEVAVLARRIAELEGLQSNTIVLLTRQEQSPPETPEQTAQRRETTRVVLTEKMDEVNRDYEAAVQKAEELRVSLNVPDNLAAKDADRALDDPGLRQYRAYWEAKQEIEEKRRFRSIMRMKVATDLLDLDLPKAR